MIPTENEIAGVVKEAWDGFLAWAAAQNPPVSEEEMEAIKEELLSPEIIQEHIEIAVINNKLEEKPVVPVAA